MADQKFIVYYRGVDKPHALTVEASEVTQEGSYLKITGSKGSLWISGESVIYVMPEEMQVKHSAKMATGS